MCFYFNEKIFLQNIFFLCYTDQRNSYRFGMTGRPMNKDRFSFWVNYPISAAHNQIKFCQIIIIVIIFAFALAWLITGQVQEWKCDDVVSMTCFSLDESHKASCTQNHNAILFNGVLLEKMFPAICTSMTSRLTFIIVSCQSWLSLGISPYAQIDFMCDAQTRLMKGSLLIICVY